jgi:hypothetical protein
MQDGIDKDNLHDRTSAFIICLRFVFLSTPRWLLLLSGGNGVYSS